MIRRIYTWLAPWKAHGFRWPHLNYTIIGAALASIILIVAVGIGVKVENGGVVHGAGLVPSPPHETQIAAPGGSRVPPKYSLRSFLHFQNDQDSSNACVSESAAEAMEITEAERGHIIKLSCAFLWAPFGGFSNVGTTYDQILGRAEQYGIAPWKDFPYGCDGYWNYATQPPPSAYGPASLYKVASFGPVLATDRYTIEFNVSHGYPLLDAMYWHSGLVNTPQGAGLITTDYGYGEFWHSVIIYAYDKDGVWIWQSWGPNAGPYHISWNLLATNGQATAYGYTPPIIYEWRPVRDIPTPKWLRPHKVFHFDQAGWVGWTARHKELALPYQGTGHLLRAAWAWSHLKHSGLKNWGSPRNKHFDRKRHVMVWQFGKGRLFIWPDRKQTVKFQAGKQ